MSVPESDKVTPQFIISGRPHIVVEDDEGTLGLLEVPAEYVKPATMTRLLDVEIVDARYFRDS